MVRITVWRWTLWALVAFAAVMVLVLSERPAAAQAQLPRGVACEPAHDILARLQQRFREFPTLSGDDGSEGRIIITYNDSDGTFTVLKVVNNLACVLAVGENAQIDKGV